METPSDERPPMAVAMEAVSRVTTIVGEMIVPGLIGLWLDKRWGTSFLALSGFALGLAVAIFHLLQMSKSARNPKTVAKEKTTGADSGTQKHRGDELNREED